MPPPVVRASQAAERLALQIVAQMPHAEPHLLGGCPRCAVRAVLKYADTFPPFVGEVLPPQVPPTESAGG